MATRTYYVGNGGQVKRLTNLTGIWDDVGINAALSYNGIMYDVETDPTDGDKVFVVGEGTELQGVYGIYVSTDAGQTWNIPGGTHNLPFIGGTHRWYEVCVIDSLNIVVSGANGYMASSFDGGLTFNLTGSRTPQVATSATPLILDYRNNYSLHFITQLIGVVGSQDNIFKTTDGGNTWTVLNGGLIIVDPVTLIAGMSHTGIHISLDQSTIVSVASHGIYRSTDAGNTFAMVYNFTARNGRHLTWINDNELWATGIQGERLKTINAGATWVVLSGQPGNDHLAAHFWDSQNGFFSNVLGLSPIQMMRTTTSGLNGSVSNNDSDAIQAVWTFIEPKCWRLINCEDAQDIIYTGTDLSAQVGQIVSLVNDTRCWTVEDGTGNCPPLTQLVEVVAIFQKCEDCIAVCYILTDCQGVEPSIITSTNLSGYVGQVIKIDNCDTCWSVSETQNCQNTVAVTVATAYTQCVECIPQPVPPPPITLRPRQIVPGYTTPGCDPEYYDNVNCHFADEIYKKMAFVRFGISSCCGDDYLKWTIEKEMLDLMAIKDPDACKPLSGQACCAPCNVQSILTVFNPISCPVPENVTSLLTILAGPCIAPDNVTSILDFT